MTFGAFSRRSKHPGVKDPYSLNPTVAVFGGDPGRIITSGLYDSIPNTGSLGGILEMPYPIADYKTEVNTTRFSTDAPRYRVSGSVGSLMYGNPNNMFKRLHTLDGGVLVLRLYQEALNATTGYGLYYSDMQGIPGDVGVHLKYLTGTGYLHVDVGDGTSIYNGQAAGVVGSKYMTVALRTIVDPADPTKIKSQGWIDGVKICETPSFVPSAADASLAYGVVGGYGAQPLGSCEAVMQYTFVLPSATEADMLSMHQWFKSNP